MLATPYTRSSSARLTLLLMIARHTYEWAYHTYQEACHTYEWDTPHVFTSWHTHTHTHTYREAEIELHPLQQREADVTHTNETRHTCLRHDTHTHTHILIGRPRSNCTRCSSARLTLQRSWIAKRRKSVSARNILRRLKKQYVFMKRKKNNVHIEHIIWVSFDFHFYERETERLRKEYIEEVKKKTRIYETKKNDMHTEHIIWIYFDLSLDDSEKDCLRKAYIEEVKRNYLSIKKKKNYMHTENNIWICYDLPFDEREKGRLRKQYIEEVQTKHSSMKNRKPICTQQKTCQSTLTCLLLKGEKASPQGIHWVGKKKMYLWRKICM